MKTSITNKIIVIFLVLVMCISFSIVVLFVGFLTKYGERINIIEIIYALIIICLLIIITSFILGRYLVYRVNLPLEALIDQIKNMQIVQENSAYDITANDEIGYLTASFQHMKTELSSYTKALEIQNTRLEAIFNNITSSLLIIDKDFNLELSNNPTGCFNDTVTDKKGLKCYEVFAGRYNPCEQCPILHAAPLAEKEVIVKEKVFKMSYAPIKYSEENDGWLVISKDITPEYLSSRKLIELDKLAQIGLVSAAITHEIKNPLAVIKSGIYYIDRLKRDHVSRYIFDKEYGDTVSMIKEAIQYSEDITVNLLDFSKSEHSPEDEAEIELNRTIDQVLLLYSHEIMKKRIKITKNITVPIVRLKIQKEILRTIIINLISNALFQMDNGGQLQISADLFGGFCQINIKDSGSGIPDDIINDIFDPFFTTKPRDHHVGIGLWIAKNEIERIGGSIAATNNHGAGATFTLTIPISGGLI